jgi:hypothetical protein
LQTAIALLKDEDLNIRRYACIALCNMANYSNTQEQIVVHGGLPMILQMATGPELNANILHNSKFSLKLKENMQEKDKKKSSQEKEPSAAILMEATSGTDLESQRLALLTLSNLASNELNHSALINKGYLKICTTAFESSDDDIRTYAAFGIANLCSNPDYLALIGKQGGIPPLIQLSRSTNVNTLSLSLAALRRLANNEENWTPLIAAGILDSLASAGTSQYLEIQREVAATLCSLSLSSLTQHRVEIAYKCLVPLVGLSMTASSQYVAFAKMHQELDQQEVQQPLTLPSTGDDARDQQKKSFQDNQKTLLDIARQSIGAVANLAEDIETHEFIAKANASKAFVALEAFHNIDIQREATRGIANLLSSFRHQSMIIEEGIPGLVTLSYAEDLEACYHSAMSFRKLTPNIKSHAVMVYAGAYKALFQLVSMPQLLIQLQAAAALRDLCANPDYKLKCAEDGGIPVLITLLRQQDEHLIALALAALRHLSLDPLLKAPIVQERAVRPILKTIALNIEDIQLQAAGILANLSELHENQITMIEESACMGLLTLAFAKNDEIQQDTSRALANLCSNEDIHLPLYKQGALTALVHLTKNENEITQKYAAMGLRFLASDPEVRILIVANKQIEIFIECAKPEQSLEYRRMAAASFASFTLHEANKPLLIQQGAIPAILSLIIQEDLAIQRDAAFAISNITDSAELQADLVREGVLLILKEMSLRVDDVRVQRDVSRAYANLAQTEDTRQAILQVQSLPAILNLAKSLDSASQRYSTLALCNLCACELKDSLIEQGILRPLIFLMRFPDPEIQRYSSLAVAGLALGTGNQNKIRIVQEGAMRPLVDLLKFPDEEVQLSSCLAVNAITLGVEVMPKASCLSEGGIEALLEIARREHYSRNILNASVYCLGSVCEQDDCKLRFVEQHGIQTVVRHIMIGDMEMKRAGAYCIATVCEQIEFHGDLDREGALQAIISLALLEDIECQEYAAFSLAHLASNRDLQVKLVNLGAVRPLVTMLSSDAEPKHYAGLALLKLADNFENHLKIAEEGGIQALLRLGRTRTTDEQLQYKAALTLGQLATNAVKLLPSNAQGKTANIASLSHATMESLGKTDTLHGSGKLLSASAGKDSLKPSSSSRVTERLRAQINAQKKVASDSTINFLDKSLAQTQQEKTLNERAAMGDTSNLMMSRSLDGTGFLHGQQTVTQAALQIGTQSLTPATPLPKIPRGEREQDNSNDVTPLHPTFRLPNK